MSLLNKTRETIKRFGLAENGTNVCVCLSGGADSSVLLHALLALKEELGINLSACHFNHGIRGEEAFRDQRFCESLCSALRIPFYTTFCDLPSLHPGSGQSMEELAREKRYAWFSQLAKKEKIHRFALAHHADDNAETVLFRTVRGTTVSGLAGIPIERELYVRPFLNVSKAEILGYAAENNIPFVTDSTNDSTDYTRNYIRHTLMPAIKVLNPSATDAFNRLSRYAAEDEAMLEGLLPAFCQKQAGHDLHPAILRRTVARNHQKVVGTGLCYQHLDTITEAVLSRQNTRITLPGGYECITEQGTFWFRKAVSAPQAVTYDGILEQNTVAVQEGKVLICCGGNHEFPDAFPKNKFVYNLSTEIILSSKGICGKIRYRTRLPGDRLNLRGVNRSIKKLMSESKIPLSVRALIPIFYDDLGVLAVPFAGVADRVYGAGEDAFRIAIYFAEDGV